MQTYRGGSTTATSLAFSFAFVSFNSFCISLKLACSVSSNAAIIWLSFSILAVLLYLLPKKRTSARMRVRARIKTPSSTFCCEQKAEHVLSVRSQEQGVCDPIHFSISSGVEDAIFVVVNPDDSLYLFCKTQANRPCSATHIQ